MEQAAVGQRSETRHALAPGVAVLEIFALRLLVALTAVPEPGEIDCDIVVGTAGAVDRHVALDPADLVGQG